VTATRYPGIEDLGGGKYRVRVWDPRTRRQVTRRVTGTIGDARRVHAAMVVEFGRPDAAVRRGKAPTVETFGEEWRRTLRHAPLTATSFEGTLRLHVYPALGLYGIDVVTRNVVAAFLRELEATGLAIATQAKIETAARSLFEAAVAEGWREASPFARVKRIPASPRDLRRQREYVPTVAEAFAMADIARSEGRTDVWAMIRVLVGTGLRGGELCGLSVDELDYPAPTWLTLGHQYQYALGAGFLAPPKTAAGERRVPLAGWVAETLAVHSASSAPRRFALPWVERGSRRGERDVALLFHGRNTGQPLQEAVLARAVRSLAARAELPGRVTPHSLRKTYTTMLGDAGVPLRVIDYVTGHESRGVTLGVYTDVTADGLERARRATEDAAASVGAATDATASIGTGLGELGQN